MKTRVLVFGAISALTAEVLGVNVSGLCGSLAAVCVVWFALATIVGVDDAAKRAWSVLQACVAAAILLPVAAHVLGGSWQQSYLSGPETWVRSAAMTAVLIALLGGAVALLARLVASREPERPTDPKRRARERAVLHEPQELPPAPSATAKGTGDDLGFLRGRP